MHRIVLAALVAFAALAATATGAHWPMFGGDAGHSGHQPVDPGFAPVGQRYAQTDTTEQNIVTSVVATAGGALVYGTHSAAGEARAHVQRLADGVPVGPQQGVDVDDGNADADAFTGSDGSVTPADTSGVGSPGVELFLHNDDNQEGGTADDPRTGGDIALAMVDPASGQLVSDETIGGQDPAGEETINMRVSSSPVLGPVAAGSPPARDLFFIAERVAATVDPLTTPCTPNASFDVVGAGGLRGCNVPAERRLFKVTITNPGAIDAAVANVTSVAVASANLKASPAIVRLTDTSGESPAVKTFVAVGTDDGFLRTFDAGTLAPGPASGDLGDRVGTPVIPVRSDGGAPEVDPPIYVTAGSAGFKAYEIRRLDPPPPAGQPRLGMMDATRDQSATVPGTPGLAGAVSALADQMPAGGRFVVPASSNLYSFDANDLRNGNALDLGSGLAAGTTGFSRTAPALQGGLVYIARDNGEHLVLDQTELDPVEGFQPFGDPETQRAANDGIGQPAITRGFIAFGGQDGLFVYRNENAPVVEVTAPPAGSTLSGTVTLRATAYNPRSGIARVRFLLNGIEAGDGVLVSGSPTSSTNPGVYELSLNSKVFGNGAYSLVAEATDADAGPDAPAETATSPARAVTITNEVPTQLSVGDVRVAEGDAGTRDATFTITKTGPGATTVTVRTSDMTATPGADYGAVSTEVSFAPGDESKTVTVPIFGDTAHEEDETFAVGLFAPTGGAGLADGSGLGIITNDDPAGPGPNDPVVSVSSASAGEGGPRRTRRMTFDVSLSRPVASPVTVAYATADQTAQAPGDYRSTGGTLTFAPGQLSESFTVTVVGDDLVEGNEVFLVRLSNAAGAGLGNTTGTGQIVDDEVARGARQRPASVTLRVKPRRDRRAPFRFTSTGNLIAPAGVSPLAACQGRVAVRVKAGRKTISTRRVRVRSNCTYRSRVTFRAPKRFPRDGRLRFRARFTGNGLLTGRSSKWVVVRTR